VVPEVAPVIRLIREDEPARIRCLRRSRSSRSFSFRAATASAASDILLRNSFTITCFKMIFFKFNSF
jgi:hypothetical protein